MLNSYLWTHAILLGLILFTIAIDDAPPKVIAITQATAANEPFSITFNKPLQTNAVNNDSIRIFKGDQEITGSIHAGTATVAFLPQDPWQSGESYVAKIGPIMVSTTKTMTTPFEQTFKIHAETLLFIDNEGRLVRGNPIDGSRTSLTPDGLEILSFSVAANGRLMAVYRSKENSSNNGILFGKRQGDQYRFTILPAVTSPKYAEAILCNNGESMLELNWGESGPYLRYSTLEWKNTVRKIEHPTWIIEEPNIYGRDDFSCSEDTARILYRKLNGAFVTNFLGEANEELVGVFDRNIGLSPRDRYLALEKSITETSDRTTYRSVISTYQANGQNANISELDVFFQGGSFDGTGSKLSALYLDLKDQISWIGIYDLHESEWVKTDTVKPPEGMRTIQHAFSLDGRTLALEVITETVGSKVPNEKTSIMLWDKSQNNFLPLSWMGKNPRWERR